MPGKELGPLQQSQRDVDALKKKVDASIKESEKSIKNLKLKDRDSKLVEQYASCTDLRKEVLDRLEVVRNLKEEDEPKAVKNFENKKTNELKRLEQFQTRLDATFTKFPEEAKPKVLETEDLEETDGDEYDSEEEDEDEDDELDDDEDDDDDEEAEDEENEEDNVQPSTSKPTSSEPELKKPAAKETVAVEEDGGMSEEDEETEDEDQDEEDGEEETEDEEETDDGEAEEQEDMELESTMRQFEAINDYEAEQPEDLSFKKGEVLTIISTNDDGWWEAENSKGEKGIVPKTYLKLYNKYRDVQDVEADDSEEALTGKKSGKEMWQGIRTALKETSVSDVLHAMGAVPSGFRQSTLAQKYNEESFRLKHYLAPKLSTSNVTFRDLFLDPSKNKIRPRTVWIEKVVTIVACRQIPPPGTGLEVLDRFVRVALFDGETILSNIHCVKVESVDRSQRSWNFSTRVHDAMDTFQHAEIMVRTALNASNLGLLFELCILYQRTSTGETGELSCGWSVLPLVEADGSCVINRGYDMYVHGGTPYERGVDVDPSISRRAASSAFMSLVSGNKQPRIIARVAPLKPIHAELLQTLPDTIVGNMMHLHFFSYYRQLLADCLLRDRLDLDSTEPLHSPVLVNFPIMADEPDLMSYFRFCWQEQVKMSSRSDMRDEEHVKDLFKQVFLDSVYPIIFSSNLPPYKSGDVSGTKLRSQEIQRFKQFKQNQKSLLAALCSPEINFKPFLTTEVSFSPIGRNCLDRPIQVKCG